VQLSPIPPGTPASRPALRTRAGLVNIVGWPAFALLATGYVALIARLTSFPYLDFPDHLARAKVLADLLFHHGARWGGIFAFHWRFVPYLLHDLVLTSLVATLGTTAGGIAFLELTALSLPCALLYYMHVHKLAPQARLPVLLVSLYLTTDWFFLVGFAAFRLAIALLVVCIALADRLRERWSTGLYAAYLAVVLAGYLEHLTVIAFLAATLVVSAGVRLAFLRTTARREVFLALPVMALLALYFGVLTMPHHSASPGVYAFDWGTVGQKIRNLQGEFYRYGGRTNLPMMALLAFCLLWPVRRDLISRRLLEPAVLEQIALAVTFVGVYAVLPVTYSGAAYVDVRALPMVVLFILFAALNLAREPARNPGPASAAAVAAAVLLAGLNLGYIGWHLEKDNTWVRRYRDVVAGVPRGALVFPIYTWPKATFLPLFHADAFVLLDRESLIPYLFAGNRGDPMSYFSFHHRPYTPVDIWYRLQQRWNRSPVFSFRVQGQSYRWPFRYDPNERDWRPAVLAPVDWDKIACQYPYIIVTEPYDPALIRISTRVLKANGSAALLAVDRSACRPGHPIAPGSAALPPQVTY
jgi:hypothetical protein